MPLIAGGIFRSHNEMNTLLRNTILAAARARISSEHLFLEDSSMSVLVGLEPGESRAEIVKRFAHCPTFIAGRVFSKNSEQISFTDQMAQLLKESGGDWLGKSLWGRYICVALDEAKREISFYRDPQGLSTMFYLKCQEGFLFSTDISLLYDAAIEKPALNWAYLTSFVVNAHNITTATAFEKICEIEPGCRTTLSWDGVETAQFWDPTQIAQAPISNTEAFQSQVYDTFKEVTKAWVEKTEAICVELSGGLDSSCVLAMLADVMPQGIPLTAVNFFHPAIASSNEIEFAQEVADSCAVPLKIIGWDSSYPVSSDTIDRRFGRPTSFIVNFEAYKNIRERTDFNMHGEFIGGQGGDHLFLAPPPCEAVADYILDNGIRGVSPLISELSAYHRMPYLTVLKKSARSLYQYAAGNLGYLPLSLTYQPWMNEAFKKNVDFAIYRPHFWNNLKKVSPSKAQHINAIYSEHSMLIGDISRPVGRSSIRFYHNHW